VGGITNKLAINLLDQLKSVAVTVTFTYFKSVIFAIKVSEYLSTHYFYQRSSAPPNPLISLNLFLVNKRDQMF